MARKNNLHGQGNTSKVKASNVMLFVFEITLHENLDDTLTYHSF